ncbi:hypothetical protein ABW21_db0201614 [Orbilia brochopaga]|nr:hypothetical protein ABW21_db0201614 [Drechslerella brochopaga]
MQPSGRPNRTKATSFRLSHTNPCRATTATTSAGRRATSAPAWYRRQRPRGCGSKGALEFTRTANRFDLLISLTVRASKHMAHATLPLPLELVFEVLRCCRREDVRSFAQTSRRSYNASFRFLYERIDLVRALQSGTLQRHEEDDIYGIVRAVDLYITPASMNFWHGVNCAHQVIETQLCRFKNLEELHIITEESRYRSDGPTAKVLRFVFGHPFAGSISTLSLSVYAGKLNWKSFRRVLCDLETELQPATQPTPPKCRLKTIKAWVSSSHPKALLAYFPPLLAPYLNTVENIELRTLWNFDQIGQHGTWMFDHSHEYISGFQSTSVKRAIVEDKYGLADRIYGKIAKVWPNIEHLEVNTGVDQKISDYDALAALGSLRRLSIPYPCYSWDLTHRDNMTQESEYVAEALGARFLSLQEVEVQYIDGDGSISRIALFNRPPPLPDGDGAALCQPFQVRGHRSQETTHLDILDMRALVMYKGLAETVRERVEKYVAVDEFLALNVYVPRVLGLLPEPAMPTDLK